MRTRAHSQLKFDLASFTFIITPRVIDFTNKLHLDQDAFFFIQIEKGAQLVCKIQQKIKPNNALRYIFSDQPLKLQIFNRKTATFAFSLYLDINNTVTFIDSFSLDLIAPYEKYTKELNSHPYEISHIMEAIQNQVELRFSWSSLKCQLKERRNEVEIKGSRQSISLKYYLEMENQMDRYESMMEKKRVKIKNKSSLGSKKSGSSVQQKKEEEEMQEQEGFKQSKSQVKTHFQSKQTSTLKEDSQLIPEIGKSSEVCPNSPEPLDSGALPIFSNSSPESHKLFLPLDSILQARKNQNLSDIIEQSYEGDSNLNSNERTDRKWRQLPEIKEERSSYRGLDMRKRKTETCLPEKQDLQDEEMRRGGSLDQIHQIGSDESIQQQQLHLKHIEEESVEESLQNTRNSFSHTFQTANSAVDSTKQRKIWLLICFLLACWACLAVATVIEGRWVKIHPVFKRKAIKKNNFREIAL